MQNSISNKVSRIAITLLLSVFAAVAPLRADSTLIGLTSTRTAFTNAEPVELSIIYKNDGGNLKEIPVLVHHSDGSVLTLVIPFDAHDQQPQVRLVSIKPGILEPGSYTVTAMGVPPDQPPVQFSVSQDMNPNAYFIGAWMQRNADWQTAIQKGGWMRFSSDLINSSVHQPKTSDLAQEYVAARMKPYSMCVMGGGHQMDLQPINDWGDPWVQRAVLWKMGLAALSNRIYPMAGMHAFDEPGLTWWPIPGDGVSPFCIPSETEDFKRVTGIQMPFGPTDQTLPMYHNMLNNFIDFMSFRLKYLEQAWWGAVTAVQQVDPAFTTINQLASSYAPGDVLDGVDDRMDIPYKVLSGHGGYSDWAGSWGPVISAESYHGWSWHRPHYFLPMWGTWDYTRMRQEVFLPWSIKLEGMEYDPNHNWGLTGDYIDTISALELADVNQRMAMVGDAIGRMPRSLSPVATLLSDRQYAWDEAELNYPKPLPGPGGPYTSTHRTMINDTFWRILSSGICPNWLDEYEVTQKGAPFLEQWKVIYCPGLMIISPKLRQVIEAYIAAGGKFIQNATDKAIVPGAITVNYAYPTPPPDISSNDWRWRKFYMDSAPTFASDLNKWLGNRPYTSNAPLDTMLMSVQNEGPATYLLMGNNNQDPNFTRGTQQDAIPLDTTINVPPGGIIYDLFNGGQIPVTDGKAPLHLAPGDGACWLRLPNPPGPMKLNARFVNGNAIQINLNWGTAGYLPFHLRILDPNGNQVDELYRATTPGPKATTFDDTYVLGANTPPGTYRVVVDEWLTGSQSVARVNVRTGGKLAAAVVNNTPVSIYFDDVQKIVDLFAGKPLLPPYDKMNWDLKRVMGGLDPTKFAVFGPDAQANRIADALRAKGMTVQVNPAYQIVPFTREPGHGGTGPIQDNWSANFENIYAHAIVLPGQALGENSWQRGHINRPVTATFPGPGRAFIQWGIGGYQAGFQDVWAFGDVDAATNWILSAIAGKPQASDSPITGTIATVKAPPALPDRFAVTSKIRVDDTPVGVGSSPDGKTTYVLLAEGSAAAYDAAGKQIWRTQPLMQGASLAVSPDGNRIAVGGFPGIFILDAATGKVIGGQSAPTLTPGQTLGGSRILSVAWNSAGTLVAGGWFNQAGSHPDATTKVTAPIPQLSFWVLDADGKVVSTPHVNGNVMGVTFVPNSDTLLIGSNPITAVDAKTGAVLWTGGANGAQAFAFSADGSQVAVGGWGNRVDRISLANGKVVQALSFDAHIGGLAFLPDGTIAAALWGGTRPLMAMAPDATTPTPLFQSTYAFQNVAWIPAKNALLAAEQDGRIWLLSPAGAPLSMLDNAGMLPFSMQANASGVLLGRLNRVVQRLTIN